MSVNTLSSTTSTLSFKPGDRVILELSTWLFRMPVRMPVRIANTYRNTGSPFSMIGAFGVRTQGALVIAVLVPDIEWLCVLLDCNGEVHWTHADHATRHEL